MQPVEHAVIAAAGLGSRLGHGMPKCMLEIGGSTIFDRLVNSLRPLVRSICVVVGYREELVIDLCARSHRDVIIVRNPEFRSTTTAQSMAMGARACLGKTLFLDGDLLLAPDSLRDFVAHAAGHSLSMGIAVTRSENAVCVRTRSRTNAVGLEVVGFTRDERMNYEWANIFAGAPDILEGAGSYVFDQLMHHLPIPAFELDLREVDTAADLDDARLYAATLSTEPLGPVRLDDGR